MTRLAEDIALLDRVATICGKVIWPDNECVVVPVDTLDVLAAEVRDRIGAPVEYRLIDDEAALLVQAARRVVIERLDDNPPKVERWTRLAELARAAIALDLVNARKSLGEVAR